MIDWKALILIDCFLRFSRKFSLLALFIPSAFMGELAI